MCTYSAMLSMVNVAGKSVPPEANHLESYYAESMTKNCLSNFSKVWPPAGQPEAHVQFLSYDGIEDALAPLFTHIF